MNGNVLDMLECASFVCPPFRRKGSGQGYGINIAQTPLLLFFPSVGLSFRVLPVYF